MCLFVHFVMGLRRAREHSKPQFMQILQYSKRRKCWWLSFYWLGRNGTNCFSRYLCLSYAVYSYTHTYIHAYLRFYCCWRFCDSSYASNIAKADFLLLHFWTVDFVVAHSSIVTGMALQQQLNAPCEDTHLCKSVLTRHLHTHIYICIPRILLCRALIRHGRQSLVEAVVLPFSLTLLRTTTYEYVCYFHFSLCHQKHLWLHLPKCVCMRVKACEIIKCEVQLFSLWQSENCVWQQIYFESRYFICATLTSSRQQLWLVVILLNDYTFAYEKVDFTRLIERDGVAKIM